MMDLDSPLVPPRLDARRVGDKDDTSVPLSAPNRLASTVHGKMQRDPDSGPDPVVFGPPASHAADATRLRVAHLIANPTRRDQVPASSAPNSQTPLSDEPVPTASAYTAPTSQRQHRQQPFSSSNSQDTSSTNDTDLVFTPSASASDGAMSPVDGSARDSSQDSQLLQLSQVAAAQERIPDASTDAGDSTASSKKRMADGMVKHTRSQSSASPVRMGGHSRNTSAVSIASTNGSRIGDLSVQLATRLSYAMRKVNNGWQGLPIDQVERLASQATSPTSSNSTIHLRNGSSASPQLSNGSQRGSNNPPATGLSQQFHARHGDGVWRDTGRIDSVGSPTSPAKATYSLAPPVSIQPSRHLGNPRRNSNSKLTPTFLSGAHASPNPGPNTPGHPSPYLGTAHQMTPWNDPILFSPRGKREQDAVESLMSMSSPGNSANLKHAFPSSSQPLPSAHTAPQRTALPTAQPRKSLPSGRPIHHGRSQSQTQKRVGFEKTRADMDMDESFGSPYSRGTPRRKVNGSGAYGAGEMYVPAHRPKPIPAPSGIMVPSRPRRARADEDIDRMLERAAAAPEDSDSDGEIQIPVSRARRDGAGAVGA